MASGQDPARPARTHLRHRHYQRRMHIKSMFPKPVYSLCSRNQHSLGRTKECPRGRPTLNHASTSGAGEGQGDQDGPIFYSEHIPEEPASGIEAQPDKGGTNDPCYGGAGNDAGLVRLLGV